MQQFYFIILNPLSSLPLSIPEAAWGVGWGVGWCTAPPWNLKFHAWYEVETYIRDTPAKMITIGDVIGWVT